MKNDQTIKKTKSAPIFMGTILANARRIIDRREKHKSYNGKPVIAIDADGEEYRFASCSDVERTTRIKGARISSAINDYKRGKREMPLVEGFAWIYEADKEEWQYKMKAWIALNAVDNRKTHI